MNSCVRCGEKLAHNYLVPVFLAINEQRRRAIVCLRCKEILDQKVKENQRGTDEKQK